MISQINSISQSMVRHAKVGEWDETTLLSQERQNKLYNLFENLPKVVTAEIRSQIERMSADITEQDKLVQNIAKESKLSAVNDMVQLKLRKKANSAYQQVATK